MDEKKQKGVGNDLEAEKNILKRKMNTLPMVAMVILICISMYAIFFFFSGNSKYVFVKSLNKWTEAFEKVAFSVSEPFSDWKQINIKGKYDVSIDSSYLEELKEEEEYRSFVMILENLKQIKPEFDVQIDKEKNWLYADIGATLKDGNLFDFIYVNKEEKQYLLLKDVFEKYLELEEAPRVQNDIKLEDVDYIWNVAKKSFQKNIKSSYIKKENTDVEIDGKKVRTTKVTLVLDGKNGSELLSNIVKDLQKDKKVKDFITSIYPEFEQYKVEPSSDSKGFYYSVYLSKIMNRPVKMSIYDDEMEISLIPGEKDQFEFVVNGVKVLSATLTSSKDEFDMIATMPSLPNSSIQIQGKRNNQDMNYEMNMNLEGVTILLTAEEKVTEVKKEEAYKEDSNISLSIVAGNYDLLKMKLHGEFDITKGAQIEDIKDSISIDHLTLEEQEKIETYFNEILSKIMEQ